MTDFCTFLESLPAEGETLLYVKQKPLQPLQYHADGAVKATWPAFLPSAKRKEGAWYANTASYIVDRMTERVSAAAANCEFVLVMVLDDIGTKSKTPPLPPTWIMETSAGNCQWGYAFDLDNQPRKGAFAAAIRAIADAGYTDPGACNPVRNFRIPGSVNLKQGREAFAARLVEFHPERTFTLAQICQALGVTPGPDDGDGPRPIRLQDDGSDDVFGWLNEQGMVYSRPNGEGWAGVLCPNADAHTDGSPEGRYNPSVRAFCCLHGHCSDWGSERFLTWVASKGGPSQSVGLREELVASRLAASLPAPTPEQSAAVAAVVAQVERKELGRLAQADWPRRYAYVESDDAFFDLDERRVLERRVFDAIYRHIQCWSLHVSQTGKSRQIEAGKWFDENRVGLGARSVVGVTYAAGETVLCARDGLVYANRWRDARPEIVPGGDPGPWLRHMERIIPNPAERAHVLDCMAFKLQHPEVKINHALLFASPRHGIGKDLAFKPFFWAIGMSNVEQLKNENLHTQWGYHLECEVLHIPELRQPESVDRRALENKLKPVIAAPPDYIAVERKGQHPYSILNRLWVVAMSNARDAISIGTDDRRWFVIWSDVAPMNTEADPDAGKRFHDWLEAGGRHAVAAWLYARDVSAFNPGATPPLTDAKLAMIGAGRSMAESWIMEQIEQRTGEFARGVVGAPWQGLCDRLQGTAPNGSRIVPAALLHALAEAGWTDLGMCHSKNYATKKHLWVAPSWTGSKSDAREAVEQPPGSGPLGGLRAVK